ncbi:unnamed protein product, partial [Symbiodinium sp. KB8]
HEKLEVLREQWESCAGKWKESQIYLSILQKSRERKMGRRVWMTRQMIVDKYKSESVADRIITNKLSNEDTKKSQTKAHPDDPDNEELRLYLIWDTEQEETTEDTILMQLFSAVDKDDDSQ